MLKVSRYSTTYVKSQFLQVVREGDQAVIWHSLFGHTRIVNVDTVNFLESFSECSTIVSKFEVEMTDEEKDIVDDLCDCYFIIPFGFDERSLLNRKMRLYSKKIIGGSLINYLSLIMSDDCNFACKYCFHSGNLDSTERVTCSDKLMKFDIAKKAVDEYFTILRQNQKKIASINFGGGEPLMAWPVIDQVLNYCRDMYSQEFEFDFSINTNASLITLDIARTLKQFSVNIAPSLDGLKHANDKVRVLKNGSGTYNSIMHGIKMLNQVGYPIQGFSVTLTDKNFYDLDESLVDLAKSWGLKDISVNIDAIGTVDIDIHHIASKLLAIRRYATSLGIEVAGFWLRPAENLGRYSHKSPISYCGAVRGNSMCVSLKGDIYSCGYSTKRLGSIFDIQSFLAPNSDYCKFVEAHLTGAIQMCQGCMIEGQCAGGCNITHEFEQANNNSKVSRMCDLYKSATKMILCDILRA